MSNEEKNDVPLTALLANRIAEKVVDYLNAPDMEAGASQASVADIIRAELEAASAWQPIETAPTDGTEVLLWWPYYRKRPVIGRCERGVWQSEVKLIEYGMGSPEDENKSNPQGWQPLPAPPQAETEQPG